MDKPEILSAYKIYLLEHGTKPLSVYKFCKDNHLSETEFYNQFNSFETIEKEIWRSFFLDALTTLEADETYQGYSAREKLLAFYFTWIQKLKENRSYILLHRDSLRLTSIMDDKLGFLRESFIEFATGIVRVGYGTREIKERKLISDQYSKGFWLQALFIMKFWVDDTSKDFEMTDAAIEKAVDLSFSLLSTNTLDSLLDFGKFMLASK